MWPGVWSGKEMPLTLGGRHNAGPPTSEGNVMRKFRLFGVLFLAFSLTGLPAGAQTPDEYTPAVEWVCDGVFDDLSFGICNAYCEAMDCDNPDRVKANDKACLAHARKWEKIAGPIPLPCNENAKISLTKSVNAADPDGFIAAGDPVEYTFTIKNEGNVPLTDIVLVDDTISAAALLACTTATFGVELDWQAPDNEIICDTTDVVIDAVAGVQVNRADVSAISVFGTQVAAHSETDYTGVAAPQVTCPCFAGIDLDEIDGKFLNGDPMPGQSCLNSDPRTISSEFIELGSTEQLISADVTIQGDFNQCLYRNTATGILRLLRVSEGRLTANELIVCRAQLQAHNDELQAAGMCFNRLP